MRDATHAELRDEPDLVLQALVGGTVAATWTTRELAKHELASRAVDSHRTLATLSGAELVDYARTNPPILSSVEAELLRRWNEHDTDSDEGLAIRRYVDRVQLMRRMRRDVDVATYDFASYGVTAAIAAIEAQRPVLHSVPIDPETLAARAMRTAKSAYDHRYPEGA